MNAPPATLDLRVRLLAEPCLWCWEIVDRNRGDALVQGSWAGEWIAYESSKEAFSAGRGRLAELRAAGAGRVRDRRKGESAA
jgi:hypothetical protein